MERFPAKQSAHSSQKLKQRLETRKAFDNQDDQTGKTKRGGLSSGILANSEDTWGSGSEVNTAEQS